MYLAFDTFSVKSIERCRAAKFDSPVNIKFALDLIDGLVRTIMVRILPTTPKLPIMRRENPSIVVL